MNESTQGAYNEGNFPGNSTVLLCGDILEVLPNLEQKHHAVLCDPPYGLEFMGQEWDSPRTFTSRTRQETVVPQAGPEKYIAGSPFQAWVTQWARLLLGAVYPGALGMFFGGTRTYHRLMCGLEDAGWEIVDCLMWLYGSGFPKAQDVSKLIDKETGLEREVVGRDPHYSPGRIRTFGDGEKYGTAIGGDEETAWVTAPASPASVPWSGHKTPALKPAWEPIILARAPRQGKSYAELAMEFGSGCLNVDGGRVSHKEPYKETRRQPNMGVGWNAENTGLRSNPTRIASAAPSGRYPANLILGEDAGAILDAQAGEISTTGDRSERSREAIVKGTSWFVNNHQSQEYPNEKGGPSRFFYCAKASRSEREAGLGGLPTGQADPTRNHHPTVKPLALLRYLATLLLPPASVKPRRLLVPFAGSGSEMIGALQAGWDAVTGIEQDAGYCQIAEARLAHCQKPGLPFGDPSSERSEVSA